MEPMTFPATGSVRVHVTVAVGDIQVREQAEAVDLHITGEKDADQVVVDSAVDSDGSLRITITERRKKSAAWRRRKGLSIALATPPNTTVVADGAAVDIHADGALDTVKLTTAAGSARLADVAYDVDVKGAAGDVNVHRVGGRLAVHLASGNVVADAVVGGTNLRTASGDISLGALSGEGSISSLSGDIDVSSVNAGSLAIHVVSGDVGVGIASGVGAALDVSTLSGSTRSDLEVSATPINGDGAQLDLKVNTLSGDIRIRRATRDTAA